MHTSDDFAKLLEPRFRKIFFDSYAEIKPQYTDIFNMKTSKKAKETDYRVSGTGKWGVKNPGAPIDEDHIGTGDEASYIHVAYAKMVTIERELADDDMYGVMDKLPRQLGRGGRETVEETAAAVINSAFSVNGYDGVPLFSASHSTISGATVSNLLPATALADDTLKVGITAMRKNQKTEAGLHMQSKASDILTGPDLEFQVLTLLNSKQVAGGEKNDKNVLPRLKPVVLDYITSETAWFLRDRNLNELNFFWRVKPEFANTKLFDNMVAKYLGYLRFSVGYSDFRGWFGSQGA